MEGKKKWMVCKVHRFRNLCFRCVCFNVRRNFEQFDDLIEMKRLRPLHGPSTAAISSHCRSYDENSIMFAEQICPPLLHMRPR